MLVAIGEQIQAETNSMEDIQDIIFKMADKDQTFQVDKLAIGGFLMLAIVFLHKVFSQQQSMLGSLTLLLVQMISKEISTLMILIFVLEELWNLASLFVLEIQLFSMLDVFKVVLTDVMDRMDSLVNLVNLAKEANPVKLVNKHNMTNLSNRDTMDNKVNSDTKAKMDNKETILGKKSRPMPGVM